MDPAMAQTPYRRQQALERGRRALEMAEKYQAGATLQEIGDYYGVTRERVRQLMTRELGVRKADGGKAIRTKAKARARQEMRTRKFLAERGMTEAEYIATRQFRDRRGRPPIYYYARQAINSAHRKIEWQLSFGQWWRIWSESGKWSERGRGKGGYVMARHGDKGPYALGNVKIITAVENQREYIRRYWKQVRDGTRPSPAKPQAPVNRAYPYKTHCKRGHEYAGNNLYVVPKTGQRVCRECDRARHRRKYQETNS